MDEGMFLNLLEELSDLNKKLLQINSTLSNGLEEIRLAVER